MPAPHIIMHKTSTCKGNTDIDYLDETSDMKAEAAIERAASRSNMSGEEIKKNRDKLIKSVDYLTKEKTGKVYAAGFLRDRILEKGGESPDNMTNSKRKKKITNALRQHIERHGKYRGAIGHKLVFSMSDELNQRLHQSGLNPDEILIKSMKTTMLKFQREFHAGDRIGYAFGVHHDTDNLHVHVYLCNRTESGKHIAMSRPLKGKVDLKPRKNQIGFVQEKLAIEIEKIWEMTNKKAMDLNIKESHVRTKSYTPPKHQNTINQPTKTDKIRKLNYQYIQLNKMQVKLDNLKKVKLRKGNLARTIDCIFLRQSIAQRKKLNNEFFSLKRKYLKDLDQYNMSNLVDNGMNSCQRKQYYAVLRQLKDKRKQGISTTKEINFLRELRSIGNIETYSSTAHINERIQPFNDAFSNLMNNYNQQGFTR